MQLFENRRLCQENQEEGEKTEILDPDWGTLFSARFLSESHGGCPSEERGPALEGGEPPSPPIHDINEGDVHALQDNSSGTLEAVSEALRGASKDGEPSSGDGTLRREAQDQPRSLEGHPLRDESGERGEPDLKRSPG